MLGVLIHGSGQTGKDSDTHKSGKHMIASTVSQSKATVYIIAELQALMTAGIPTKLERPVDGIQVGWRIPNWHPFMPSLSSVHLTLRERQLCTSTQSSGMQISEQAMCGCLDVMPCNDEYMCFRTVGSHSKHT